MLRDTNESDHRYLCSLNAATKLKNVFMIVVPMRHFLQSCISNDLLINHIYFKVGFISAAEINSHESHYVSTLIPILALPFLFCILIHCCVRERCLL